MLKVISEHAEGGFANYRLFVSPWFSLLAYAVARAVVHPEMGGLAAKVLGVIHGVMPTHGAAAAYRRCRAGSQS